MQGGERTTAGRKLAAAAAAALAAAASAPVPPRDAEPEPPAPTEKAAVAAAEMAETEMEERAAAAEPATLSRSVSVVVAEATEARLKRWRTKGKVDLHGGPGARARVSGERKDEGGPGTVEAKMSLSDVKLLTGTIRCSICLGHALVLPSLCFPLHC